MAALLGVVATASLGRWQLSRAAQKEALQSAIQTQGQLPALDGRSLLTVADPLGLVHRTVRLRGTWMADKTVFLDNRPMAAKVGFYMLTPLQLEGSRAVVLVQRGWVQRDFEDRSRLPKIESPETLVELQGRISPPPAQLYNLGGAGTGLIRQNLDLAAYGAETSLPLLPVSVLQTSPAADGLLREWPAANLGAEKHYGYAFQWFGLSSLIAILYVWFQIVRKVVPRR